MISNLKLVVPSASTLLFVLGMFSAQVSPARAAQATGTGGTVQGSVTDPSGALIAGAEVTLSNSVSGHKQDGEKRH